jgi:hypothetical protein
MVSTFRPKLRVGAILDSLVVPAWVGHLLTQIDHIECLSLVLLVHNGTGVRQTEWERLHYENGPSLFRALTWLDYRSFRNRTEQPNAVEMVGFTPILSTPRVLQCAQREKSFDTSDLAAIRDAGIDVLLDFTGNMKGGVLHNYARYGVWSLATVRSVVPSLLRDMCDGQCELESRLRVAEGNAIDSVVHLVFPTDFISLFRNYNRYCWGQAEAMTRTLVSLQHYGWTYISKQREESDSSASCALPTNRVMARSVLQSLACLAHTAVEKACLREDWFIAYRQHRPVSVPEEEATQFAVVKAPGGRFYADPFIVERDGKTFIFFEDYSFKNRKAVISAIEIDGDGKPGSSPQPVLEMSYHISYPCIFEWDGQVYMLPETKGNRTIELYRATDFPWHWRLERVLFSGVSAVDSTILRYNEKFWLFTCGLSQFEELFNGDNELFVFFSDNLHGPWMPHPKNPIVSDVRRCRPAGHLFVVGGQLIRPSQNCSGRYGRGVCFNRVDVLSETDYAETPIATISNGWFPGNVGTHTFNQSSRYQVVDGRTLISRFMTRSSRQTSLLWTNGITPLVAPFGTC